MESKAVHCSEEQMQAELNKLYPIKESKYKLSEDDVKYIGRGNYGDVFKTCEI